MTIAIFITLVNFDMALKDPRYLIHIVALRVCIILFSNHFHSQDVSLLVCYCRSKQVFKAV
ncbi:hypothetical protein PENTCL1PPCAC_24489 [Pristionchus entomophagus]|uniref:G protein-coupled receptor n=1 Tax=Pristionchus entomophagus TaxID=358040 RepID=A0AAV5U661_9BILA|nr:hypothetical protein PENTCL1PPCAC_24489 [Pristionchus entomophagus]